MNSNPSTWHRTAYILIFAAAALLASGASESIPNVVQTREDPNIGIKYKKNQGLFVTDISARLIGLKIAEVEERRIPGKIVFTAQVYETKPAGKALATGWLPSSSETAVRVGADVSVSGGRHGKIIEVVTLAATITHKLEALLEIDASNDKLSVSDFVEVEVTVPASKETIVVPRSAVLKTSEGTFVYADNSGWKVRTQVKTGAEQDGWIEVTDGLYAGDAVVVEPAMTLWMTELQLTKSGKT
jgi:multidrug efflux pump subunit AcrA (membrane-fusion protein)